MLPNPYTHADFAIHPLMFYYEVTQACDLVCKHCRASAQEQSHPSELTTETDFGWVGPYITWKKDANNNDWPDDAWGHDYIFFTRVGALFAPGLGFDDDKFHRDTSELPGGGTDDLFALFDRPTILSVGPDGQPGDGTDTDTTNDIYGLGDDIFRSFGQ